MRVKFFSLLVRLWSYFSFSRRRQIVFSSGLMALSSIAELLTLSILVPFLAALVNPKLLWENKILGWLLYHFGVNSFSHGIFFLSACVALLSLLSAKIRSLNLFYSCKLSASLGSDIAVMAFEKSISQPYSTYLQQNSNDIVTRIRWVGLLIGNILQPLLGLTSSVVLSLSIIAALLWYSSLTAILIFLALGTIYAVILLGAKDRLKEIDRLGAKFDSILLKTVVETLGLIREIILEGNQSFFIKIFKSYDKPYRNLAAEASILSMSPRYWLESSGFALIAFASAILVLRNGPASAFSTIGLIAVATQKLLPTFQQIYSSTSLMLSSQYVLEGILELLDQPVTIYPLASRQELYPFQLKNQIQIVNLSFGFEANKEILSDVNIMIKKGDRVGFAGLSGCGKSTLSDLLMGLLKPTTGSIYIDDLPLWKRESEVDFRWRQSIAHVPQSIYLCDATVAENIAFGELLDDIDFNRLEKVATIAQAINFISSLPNGFLTIVGERGSRLSGGQRQRIGIARALYKEATLLLLDEATSALDNHTEKAVMKSIFSNCPEVTIVVIAHRLSTLMACDQIFELGQGTIQSHGTFDWLIENSDSFRALASNSSST